MSAAQQTNQTVLQLHLCSQFQCLAIRLELLNRLLSRFRYQVCIAVQDSLRMGLVCLSHFEQHLNHFWIVDSQQRFVSGLLVIAFITLTDFGYRFCIAYLCQYRIVKGRISRLSHTRLDSRQLCFLRKRKKRILHGFLNSRNLLTLFQQFTQTIEILRFYHTSQCLISRFTNSCILRIE